MAEGDVVERIQPDTVAQAVNGQDTNGGGKRRRAWASNDRKSKQELLERKKQLAAEAHRLPVNAARNNLIKLVKENRVVVLVGETGSGKTTQIPQYLYHARLGGDGLIACTQPRRVAAVSVARRVAEEMGTMLGDKVGYTIRFDDTTSPRTRIKYMTDGMLLREALLDPHLSRYKVILLDEAHERTINTDVLLGLLKKVLAAREADNDFRLVVMSATLEAAKFVNFLPGAVAAMVHGRTYPVQLHYTAQPQDNYLDAAVQATLQIHADEGPGDVLVFLTGQDEIESVERLLKDQAAALKLSSDRRGDGVYAPTQLLVLPIFAALNPEQQMKVFEPAPPGTRKAILATNIAETSITISGVRYVIDTGMVKARAYSAKLGVDSLQVVPISKAQARQRSGRAGREASGKAYRLYTEAGFQTLDDSTEPELLRSNLGSVVLNLKAMGIRDPLTFDFMDPPPRQALIRSLELLFALGALDTTGAITESVGIPLSKLPVDPMYGKVLLAAADMGCALEATQVIGIVSSDGLWLEPRAKRDEAAAAHAKFRTREGDHCAMLAVARSAAMVSPKQLTTWCHDNFINVRSLRKAMDIQKQLEGHLQAMGLAATSSCGDDTTVLRRALTSGLFPHAARKQADGSYKVIATGQQVFLHPSSCLVGGGGNGKKPDCIVFNELLQTNKPYARVVAVIEQSWLPELCPAFFAAKAGAATGAVAM